MFLDLPMRDPYQILGVPRASSADDIKKAYRQLAKKLHPDANLNNPNQAQTEQKFKEVTAAYDLLSDPEKRARFDRGEIDASGAERGGFYRGGGAGGDPFAGGRHQQQTRSGPDPFGGFGSEDFFAEFFGGGKKQRAQQTKQRGGDILHALSLPFTDAALGCKRRISLSSGRTIEITIPPGTEDGQKLRLKGQGLTSPNGGESGDAIVEISVTQHPDFTVKNGDLYLDCLISLPEAVLGGNIPVQTLDGPVSLKIPAGSNSGTTLRLKGKGIPQKNGQRGDQYVRLTVVLPATADDDLTKFIEKWAKKNAYDPRQPKK
jgi:DnaJ-class molecular chaperone